MRTKLIIILLTVKIVPLIIVVSIAWQQISFLATALTDIAEKDSTAALNNSATENIERMTTDTALKVADFLYDRDDDILYLASLQPSAESYKNFSDTHTSKVITAGEWVIAADGRSWVPTDTKVNDPNEGKSTNAENNDLNAFNYRYSENYSYKLLPIYDEITYVDLDGNETVKYVSPNSPKVNHPMNTELGNISQKADTYIGAEDYFDKLSRMQVGDIYVSDVIGAYVGTNYIGMYTPDIVKEAAEERGYDIEYDAESQAYSAAENPVGKRFEGIVRWATPTTDENGVKNGYVTFALNHDHIMEFVDHITPMKERYTELPSAYLGNYAFIWDYKCRNICHPRHHSIYGFDAETGNPEIPWLETSIYEGWQSSGVENWFDYVADLPEFDNQSRSKAPAAELTQNGYVGLDGRYLNNAPQCTGWMDLTRDGGSGSFYILWSGLYKLTTAGAIPYYTGQYAPSEENDFSKRGFGIVTIGAGLEDFAKPSNDMALKLEAAGNESLSSTSTLLLIVTVIAIIIMIFIAIWIASSMTNNITALINGFTHFRSGERQFRFNSPANDEFGTLFDSFDDMANSIDESIKNPICIIDMDHIIKYTNEHALAVYGQSLDEISGTNYDDTSIYPHGTEYCPITSLDNGTESQIYYYEALNRYFRGIANYLYGKDGVKIGYIIESIDMTETILKQAQIEQQRAILNIVFDNSPDVIWYQNTKRELITANPRFADISGKPISDIIGKPVSYSLPPELERSARESDHDAIEQQRPLYTEEKYLYADGHEEIMDVVRTPILDTNKNLIGLLGFARNMTKRYKIESELRRAKIDLETAVSDANDANKHKGDFLARMSHEIRTPMNAIIGLTSIMLKDIDGKGDAESKLAEIKTNTLKIESSSQHLMGLLNDILDISKIDAGKIDLSYETTDFHKLVGTLDNIIRPRCEEKGITFEITADDFSDVGYITDPLRLRQVLINLLGNAVKFTNPGGTIRLTMKKLGSHRGKAKMYFSVEDNGIGITKEAQPTIFDAFEQENDGITRRFGGTGLGLAISKRIVYLLGGDIKLQSETDKGSNFSFELWFDEAELEKSIPSTVGDCTGLLVGKTILLVDDIEINRMIINLMLEDTGVDIKVATNGKEAVEIFENSSLNHYDMILMDIQMPVMNGYDATRAIRALDRPDAQSVAIIALTANAFKEDIDRALESGMNGHLAKPVEADLLFEIIWKYLLSD